MSGVYPKDINPKSKKTTRISFSLNNLLREVFGLSLVRKVITEHLQLHGFDTYFTGLKFKRIATLVEIHPDSFKFDLHNVATIWLKVMVDRLITKRDKQLCECIPDDNMKYVWAHYEAVNYDLPPATIRFTIIEIQNEKPDSSLLGQLATAANR